MRLAQSRATSTAIESSAISSRLPSSSDLSEASALIPREWEEEFDAAARRPLAIRFRYSFIRTYKPVLDDEPYRSFETSAEYRRWCDENIPDWLVYGSV